MSDSEHVNFLNMLTDLISDPYIYIVSDTK